ncbi:MAG: membrane protein insertase YidC [Bdellovibrionales bacterium]|nr:membrane protein insertase YidC [Bdellovibrionales bacterium]
MSTEKRMLLAIVLIMGVTFVWSKLFFPQQSQQSTNAKNIIAEQNSDQAAQTATESLPQVLDLTPDRKKTSQAKVIALQNIEFETPESFGTVSSHMASLQSFELTTYKLQQKQGAPGVSLVPFTPDSKAPLQWKYTLGEKTFFDRDLYYQVVEKDTDHVSFRAQLLPQVFVEKTWYFQSKPYVLDLDLRIINQSLSDQALNVQIQNFARPKENTKKTGIFSMFSSREQPLRAMAYVNEKNYHWTYEDILDGENLSPKGSVSWLGFDSQYFVFSVLPDQGNWSGVEASTQDEQAVISAIYPDRTLASGKVQEFSVKVYAGPKDIDLLREVGNDLDLSIDYGIWGPIARPILSLLRWIHGFVPNYGFAIIILTLLVRALMFPLVQKQARSMKKMQAHQPAMNALKEKHGEDKEAYTRELMTYMRTHKINPMGGCLLLLPQMPIFFALYRVLYNAVELRHAPFALWIKDLSSHDPFYVLPVLVGITFFLQSKLNPTPTSDPAQQTMMKIMPVMFSVFMVFLPSGLNLYIFVSTVWGIVQQYIVQRKPAV